MRPGQRLTAHEYHQRLDEIANAFSGRYGEVEYGSAESPSGRRAQLEVRVRIPGWDLPLQATLVFIEKHVSRKGEWERYAYLYDLHGTPGARGRFAYHWHDDVAHRHCMEPGAPRRDHHYEGVFFDDIGWAADELFRLSETGISCRGLRPLRDVPPEPSRGSDVRKAATRKRPAAPRRAGVRLLRAGLQTQSLVDEFAAAQSWQIAQAWMDAQRIADGDRAVGSWDRIREVGERARAEIRQRQTGRRSEPTG